MKQDFSKVMSKRTTEELIEIVRIKREDYQKEAVEAAEKELDKRQVNPNEIEEFEEELTEKGTKIKDFNSSKAPAWTRLIHFIVDIFGFFFTALNLSFIIGLFIGFFAPTSEEQIMLGKIGYLLILISFFLYYVIMEYKYQKTIGKFLTKTKVVMNDGRKPELNVILYRTASRLIPFDQISFLFTKNGFHDRFSNTTVIKDEKKKLRKHRAFGYYSKLCTAIFSPLNQNFDIEKMKTITILTLTIICLLGCNSSQKSDGNEKGLKESHSELSEIQIQVIEEWPDEIDGCSCYFSSSKDEFETRKYIYMDDYEALAFVKINGQLERFKLTKSDTLVSSDHSRETWTNENFEITIETQQIGQIDETWQHKGKLTLKRNDGEIIEQDIYGECGC